MYIVTSCQPTLSSFWSLFHYTIKERADTCSWVYARVQIIFTTEFLRPWNEKFLCNKFCDKYTFTSTRREKVCRDRLWCPRKLILTKDKWKQLVLNNDFKSPVIHSYKQFLCVWKYLFSQTFYHANFYFSGR